MASILFFIETILRKQFRCKYLEKQTAFSQYFSAFFKCSLNFEDFQKKKKKKKESPGRGYFRNYRLRKTWLYQCLKSPVSRDPSETNIVNGPKHC